MLSGIVRSWMNTGNTLRRQLGRPMAKSGNRGMTLIEIIIVIALIVSLMAILVKNLTSQQDEAMRDQAKLAAGNIMQSLQMYKVHNHSYPTTDQGLNALVTDPGNSKNWRGPYIEASKIKDPWGNPYQFESDGRMVKMVSPGPDEQVGTADDITYPEEDKK
jgi:general secretion pathway protein G